MSPFMTQRKNIPKSGRSLVLNGSGHDARENPDGARAGVGVCEMYIWVNSDNNNGERALRILRFSHDARAWTNGRYCDARGRRTARRHER